MKTISLKAGGWPQFPQILAGIKYVISLNRVATASISATVCLIAAIFEQEPLMFGAAFTTLAVIKNVIKQEGGEK